MNGILGKNMTKFCSGDFRPESCPPDTKHLDPLLAQASKSPPTHVSTKGLDGMFPCNQPSSGEERKGPRVLRCGTGRGFM